MSSSSLVKATTRMTHDDADSNQPTQQSSSSSFAALLRSMALKHQKNVSCIQELKGTVQVSRATLLQVSTSLEQLSEKALELKLKMHVAECLLVDPTKYADDSEILNMAKEVEMIEPGSFKGPASYKGISSFKDAKNAWAEAMNNRAEMEFQFFKLEKDIRDANTQINALERENASLVDQIIAAALSIS